MLPFKLLWCVPSRWTNKYNKNAEIKKNKVKVTEKSFWHRHQKGRVPASLIQAVYTSQLVLRIEENILSYEHVSLFFHVTYVLGRHQHEISQKEQEWKPGSRLWEFLLSFPHKHISVQKDCLWSRRDTVAYKAYNIRPKNVWKKKECLPPP